MNQQKKTSPFRYAVGMFGTSIPINMFKTYAAAFYVIGHGVTTAQFSMVLFLYTFVDAIDNPVYGFLSDRTRTRWGRRRPWLVIGAPLLALCFIAFFNIPAFLSGSGIFSYMLLMYILTGTLDSLINANYGALFPELFTSDSQRAKSNAMRQAFQLLAMVISIALTPLVTDALGYGLTSIIYGILAVAVILYCTFGCHEITRTEDLQKPRLFSTLRDLLTNPKFWIFGLTNAFYSAAMSLVMSAVPFSGYVRGSFLCKIHAGTRQYGKYDSSRHGASVCHGRCVRVGAFCKKAFGDAGMAYRPDRLDRFFSAFVFCLRPFSCTCCSLPSGLRLFRGHHYHGFNRRPYHG